MPFRVMGVAVVLLGLVVWWTWPGASPEGAHVPSGATAAIEGPTPVPGAGPSQAAFDRRVARHISAEGGVATELETWPRAYRPGEMRKVGDYLSAWLAERPAREADPDESVRVDCREAPCVLSFSCDRRVAESMDLGAMLTSRMQQLTAAECPVVVTDPESEEKERVRYAAFFVPPELDAQRVQADVMQRLPGW